MAVYLRLDVAGQAMNCAPGDRILEFGAGPAYGSELLNRLGYQTVALDRNPEIMRFARGRMALDRRLEPAWASFLAGYGLCLAFAKATFDGVLCLNALHHMFDSFRRGQAPTRNTRPFEIANFIEFSQTIFVLSAPDQRPLISARPGHLRATIVLLTSLPPEVSREDQIVVEATVTNCGDTLWLSEPRKVGGYATFGVKISQADGRLLLDKLGRTLLAKDVPPGGVAWVRASLRLPPSLPLGRYLLRLDMVDEQIAWFEQGGLAVLEHLFVLVA